MSLHLLTMPLLCAMRTGALSLVLSVCLSVCPNPVSAQPIDKPTELILWQRNYENPPIREVLELLIEKSAPEFGPAVLHPSTSMEQGRAFVSLKEGRLVQIAVAGPDDTREAEHTMIYVPIDRGLLGFRVCLTREDHSGFGSISRLSHFEQSGQTIGTGSHWPDRQILEANGLVVSHSPVYLDLFDMLLKQRFTCFARSLNELDRELAAPHSKGLKVEPHIAFVYPYADFIFISKTAPGIHARLQAGIDKALKDGSFQRLFEHHYRDVLLRYGFFDRNLIYLRNPFLSKRAKAAINRYGIASFSDGF